MVWVFRGTGDSTHLVCYIYILPRMQEVSDETRVARVNIFCLETTHYSITNYPKQNFPLLTPITCSILDQIQRCKHHDHWNILVHHWGHYGQKVESIAE